MSCSVCSGVLESSVFKVKLRASTNRLEMLETAESESGHQHRMFLWEERFREVDVHDWPH